MTDSITRLRERRNAIATELRELDERAAVLRTEDAELESAERVFARFVETDNPEDTSSKEAEEVGSGKPPNTPTTPQMIISLLKDAERQGKRGLEPREITIQITKRWWPGVKSEDVAPTAWRMWKAGRLDKDGPLYMIKNEQVGDLLKN